MQQCGGTTATMDTYDELSGISNNGSYMSLEATVLLMPSIPVDRAWVIVYSTAVSSLYLLFRCHGRGHSRTDFHHHGGGFCAQLQACSWQLDSFLSLFRLATGFKIPISSGLEPWRRFFDRTFSCRRQWSTQRYYCLYYRLLLPTAIN